MVKTARRACTIVRSVAVRTVILLTVTDYTTLPARTAALRITSAIRISIWHTILDAPDYRNDFAFIHRHSRISVV